MYIKQLVVHGFKSYRDETVFGPFSPQHNVIGNSPLSIGG